MSRHSPGQSSLPVWLGYPKEAPSTCISSHVVHVSGTRSHGSRSSLSPEIDPVGRRIEACTNLRGLVAAPQLHPSTSLWLRPSSSSHPPPLLRPLVLEENSVGLHQSRLVQVASDRTTWHPALALTLAPTTGHVGP